VAALAAVELSYIRLHTDTTSSHVRVLAELEEPLRTFEELDDEAGLARVFALMALLSFFAGRAGEAMTKIELAAQHAREAGDREQEEFALSAAVNFSVHGPLPVDAGLALISAARTRLTGRRSFELVALAASSVFQAMCGHFDEARVLVAEAGDIARELGREYSYAVRVGHAAGRIEALSGDWAASARVLTPSCLELERMGDLGHLSSLAPQLVDALYGLERFDEAWQWAEKASAASIEDDLDSQVATRRVRAKLLARRGELDDALRVGREAVELAGRSDYLQETALAWADLAEVHRLAGRRDDAAAALEQAIRIHEGKGNVAAIALLRRSVGEPVSFE
jgi:tetratricopeptide (TPR) repeat protein